MRTVCAPSRKEGSVLDGAGEGRDPLFMVLPAWLLFSLLLRGGGLAAVGLVACSLFGIIVVPACGVSSNSA